MGGDISDPQSLNRYAYVRNNPINATDPSGMDCLSSGGGCGGGGGFSVGFDWGWDWGGGGWSPPPQPPYIPPPNASGGPFTDPLGGEADGMPVDLWRQTLGIGHIPGISVASGSGCTYGSGSCGGGVYGFTDDPAEILGGAGAVCGIQPEICPIIGIGLGAYGIYEVGQRTGVGPVVYSTTKKAADQVAQHLDTALEHLGKLGGPDQDPRNRWKDTVRKSADNIDKKADKIANKHLRNSAHYIADLLRGLVD